MRKHENSAFYAMKNRKEEGSNSGLVYAMCFVAFVTCLYLFVMMEYRAKIHMLKDEMETKLHIVENYCLTVNQMGDIYSNEFERERDRAHIITLSHDNPRSNDQVIALGKAFSERFKEEFGLNGTKPNGGVLAQMTNNGEYNQMATLHIESLVIYEPTYTPGEIYPVYCGSDTHDHEASFGVDGEDCRYSENYNVPSDVPSGFCVVTSIEDWYVYEFEFDENNNPIPKIPRHLTKNETPQAIANVFGQTYPAEGATIQATIRAEFARPFGFWGENMNLGGLESVEVTEGIDIVFSSYDSRQK